MQKLLTLLDDCELSPAAFGDCSHELRGIKPLIIEAYLRSHAALRSLCMNTYYDEIAKGLASLWLVEYCRWDAGIGICVALLIYLWTGGESQ